MKKEATSMGLWVMIILVLPLIIAIGVIGCQPHKPVYRIYVPLMQAVR